MSRQRLRYSIEFKRDAVRLVVEQGVPVTTVAPDLGVDRTVIRSWTEKAAAWELVAPSAIPRVKLDVEDENRRLRRENARLREEREIPKRNSGLLRPGEPMTAFRFIQAEKANHTIRTMCRVLRVSGAGYYDWKARPSAGNGDSALVVHIRSIYRESHGTYGSPRVAHALRGRGIVANRKVVGWAIDDAIDTRLCLRALE
jgi:transposase-like protein